MNHAKDEESLSLVRSADFLRFNECCRNLVAQCLKASDDLVSSKRQMIGDVFEENGSRSDLAHDALDAGPQVPGIVGPPLATGH